MRRGMGWSIAVGLGMFCFAFAIRDAFADSSSAPATAAASTQPVMSGRDTPAGAMNVFERAVENFDTATVADSYNLPEAMRVAYARRAVAEARFCDAVEERFGHETAVNVCHECRAATTQPWQEYVADDWESFPGQPDKVSGKIPPKPGKGAPPLMQRGPDGIWRIGRLLPATTRPWKTRASVIQMNSATDLADRLDAVTPNIKAGKYATPDDVIHAVYPEGSPMARFRAMQQEQKAQDEKQDEAAKQQLLAAHFDASTLEGAVGAFVQARTKNDLAGMANFYFVQGDAGDKLAQANARRVLSAIDFENAVNAHVTVNGDKFHFENPGATLAGNFGLISERLDSPDRLQFHENGDRAVGTASGPEENAVWLQRVGGIWKQDITPQPPLTVAGRTEDMEEDSAAVERITADISQGKYTTLPQIRDALGAAMLNARPDPMFARSMRVGDERQPGTHPRADISGPVPMKRTSPAGAMNSFVQAIEKLDAAGLADVLYMPEDKDGSCRRAAARDYIVGMKFLAATEARFGQDDAQRICFWCKVIQRDSLRAYSDEEWIVPPEYPDLALDSGAAIRTQTVSNGQTTINYEVTWIPLMHRGADGIWRIGPRFAENSRKIHAEAAALGLKDAVLEKAIVDIKAGKYATPEDLLNAIGPSIGGS
jgi:hypothetical protein